MPLDEPPDIVQTSAVSASGSTENKISTDKRFFRPLIIFVLLGIGIPIILLLLGLQLFVAQRIPELTEARLEAAQQLWQQRGPANYDMEVEIRGARPGIVQLQVRNGEPTSVTLNGRPPSRHTWNTWSVIGMFDTLERELMLAEDPQHEMNVAPGALLRLRCEFDPQYGYPRRYHRHATGGAPEVFWLVKRLEPR